MALWGSQVRSLSAPPTFKVRDIFLRRAAPCQWPLLVTMSPEAILVNVGLTSSIAGLLLVMPVASVNATV